MSDNLMTPKVGAHYKFENGEWQTINDSITVMDNYAKFYSDDIKSILKLGNLNINITKKLNWFQKIMWKICFGITVENIKV